LRSNFDGRLKVLPQPTCAEVLDAMPGKPIVHFACHGYLSARLPSSSGLVLKNCTGTEILPVSSIERISIPHAEIAYLSACSTAELALGKHIDEAINLVNCFQMLGFRHVVGTIWSASDESAGRVASAFYTNILKSSNQEYGRLNAAQALHEAIMEYAAECKDGDGPLHWGPYVHVGT
jgi:CHAT domain-containing protein